jgi:large repetitive protein
MRFTMAITTAVVALLAALAVAVGAGAGVAGAATGSTTAPSWSTLQTYSSATIDTSTSTLSGTVALATSVACPSYGTCVAVGGEATSTEESPVVMVESGPGQWGQPVSAPLPSNAVSGADDTEFSSVACSSATSCIAVGAYPTSANGTQPFAVPFTVSGSNVTFGTPQQVSLPSNAYASSSQVAFLNGVSCGSGGCTAVGTYQTNASTPSTRVWAAMTATPGAASGAWTSTAVAAPAGAANDSVLNAISCPATGACETVGTYANSSNDMELWVVQVNNGAAGTAQPVTISGATATGDTTPAPATNLDLRAGLAAVSCPSAGVCTAAGTVAGSGSVPAAVLLPISAGTPGQSSTLSANSSVAFTELDGISCSDASDCTAVGVQMTGAETDAAIAATETGGSWSAPVTLQASNAPSAAEVSVALAETVACTSPGVCVSAGLNLTETGTGSTAVESEGSFFAYSAFAPTVTTSSLPAATVGKPYSTTLQSSGGSGTGSWAVTLGSLPAGLTLNSATGVISGTPKANGQNGFVVTTTNAGPPSLSATASLSITIGAAPTVTLAYSKISGRSALIVFSCSGAKCAGTYKLTGVEHLHDKQPTAVDAKAKKHPKKSPSKRTVTLARGHYSINAGGGKAIVVKLNGTGAKLLRELHKISGRLTLTPTGSKTAALIKTLKFRS